MISNKVFILAAGFGMRMRPLTLSRPKPLVEVGGRSLIDYTMDHFEAVGVDEFVVNAHYKADQIEAHVRARCGGRGYVSHEPEILDTGGGLKKTLDQFGSDPFFVTSGDGLWTDGVSGSALAHMKQSWDDDAMDILMLLQPTRSMVLTKGVGDYDFDGPVDNVGRAVRSKERGGAHMFTSIRINHPRIFADTPDGAFSYLDLMDRAEQAGRLYGLIHDGDWHHISTPEDLAAVGGVF